jgi:hypothetical protein
MNIPQTTSKPNALSVLNCTQRDVWSNSLYFQAMLISTTEQKKEKQQIEEWLSRMV